MPFSLVTGVTTLFSLVLYENVPTHFEWDEFLAIICMYLLF